jgi:glucose-1-phosphate cytidylyltransferase
MTKVVILAGGLGTRLKEETVFRPKPMVEIGGRPILWHIMKIYSHYGFRDFVIALGYKGEVIKDYFLNYYNRSNDITVSLTSNRVEVHNGETKEDWRVTLVDTGLESQTGGRIKQLRKYLGNEAFMATYGDGVSNVDIGSLFKFHKSHGKLATVTAVRPPSRFGEILMEGTHVKSFAEKPQVGSGAINGGFFVFEPGIFDYIEGDSTHLEEAPMTRLAQEGEIQAFLHTGYWHCMDTLRDNEQLNKEWAEGRAGWKVWKS